jgi:ubiquinone/menaquinone biosynthesis C-methylase UbiE
MKIRDSGMPDEQMWEQFFAPEKILRSLGLVRDTQSVVEFGCGYGTFSVAAAQIIAGTVHGLDIEGEMLEVTRQKAKTLGVENITLHLRDFITDGTGFDDGSVDYAMLFNILHPENPASLLTEAHRILRSGGIIAVIHWNYDEKTPRGPAMEIRPRPEDIRGWLKRAGFSRISGTIQLPPYHYGMTGIK